MTERWGRYAWILTYRAAKSDDIPFLFRCYSESSIAERATLNCHNDYDEFQRDYSGILRDEVFHVYILESREEAVGFIQLRVTDSDVKRAEGCIWLGRKRRLGYGVRALCLLLKIAFEDLQYKELWGWVRENNEAMMHICRKLGIRNVGSTQRPAWKAGVSKHFATVFYYEMTLDEYSLQRDIFEKYTRR